MAGPTYGSPEYEAWVRSVIAGTQETIRQSQELVRRTDEHLVSLNAPADRVPGPPVDAGRDGPAK